MTADQEKLLRNIEETRVGFGLAPPPASHRRCSVVSEGTHPRDLLRAAARSAEGTLAEWKASPDMIEEVAANILALEAR